MRFRIGLYTCELFMKDGDLKAEWIPWQPRYLNKALRAEYNAYRTLFLERQERQRPPTQPDQVTNTHVRLVEAPSVQTPPLTSDWE